MAGEEFDLSIIRAEADRIHSACDEIEVTLGTAETVTAEDWRIVLGYVDDASKRVYTTRKILLDEARRRANEHRSNTHGNTDEGSADDEG